MDKEVGDIVSLFGSWSLVMDGFYSGACSSNGSHPHTHPKKTVLPGASIPVRTCLKVYITDTPPFSRILLEILRAAVDSIFVWREGLGMPSRRGSRALFVLLAAVCITYARIAAAGVLQTVLEEQDTWKVALPKGTQPEGIAAGSHNDLWVACLSGNIIHVVS